MQQRSASFPSRPVAEPALWFSVAATVFALIVPAELPDKTFVATLVLTTPYKPSSP